jgi:hypothetical protein
MRRTPGKAVGRHRKKLKKVLDPKKWAKGVSFVRYELRFDKRKLRFVPEIVRFDSFGAAESGKWDLL